MSKPEPAMVVKWRDLAEEGYLYAEISRMHPRFSVDQVRHYCLGHTGRKLGGPIQRVDRWYGSNVWLRGEHSPHAELTAKQLNAHHAAPAGLSCLTGAPRGLGAGEGCKGAAV